MRVRYVKNGESKGLPSFSGSIEEYTKYLYDTFSFPEDENADIALQFIIPNDSSLLIPTRLLVPLKHKNPKIRINVEFFLSNVQSLNQHEQAVTYRN